MLSSFLQFYQTLIEAVIIGDISLFGHAWIFGPQVCTSGIQLPLALTTEEVEDLRNCTGADPFDEPVAYEQPLRLICFNLRGRLWRNSCLPLAVRRSACPCFLQSRDYLPLSSLVWLPNFFRELLARRCSWKGQFGIWNGFPTKY